MPRTKSKALTDKARKVLDFIRARHAAGEPTSLKAVAEHIGWSAPSTAADCINSLRSRRLVLRRGHKLIPISAPESKPHGK